MSVIVGRFYFKLTENGNLLGEYSNNITQKAYTESAVRIEAGRNEFSGDYHSAWVEDGKAIYAKLVIGESVFGKIYSLKWEEKSGVALFVGRGMLVDGILIGNYSNDLEYVTPGGSH